MAREIVFDANVIVGQLDSADNLASRSHDLGSRLRAEGAEIVLLDVLVAEAISVLCRRARERKGSPLDLAAILATARRWGEQGAIRWVGGEAERCYGEVVGAIETTGGRLSFIDALLVVLQREGTIGEVASFDAGLDVVPGFQRIT
jgi:predicted nucleic acid-binding protein